MTVNVTVEFSGGLELLFNKRRKIAVTLPGVSADSQDAGKDASPSNSIGPTIAELITFLATKEITHPDRSLDVFLSADGSVRPGILVLINETDWELEGEAAYVLQEGDVILFVSTLHGG